MASPSGLRRTPAAVSLAARCPSRRPFDDAAAVILPVPLDRTTSYVPRHAQRPARDPAGLRAGRAVGRGDRRRRPRRRHLHAAGDGPAVRRRWTPLHRRDRARRRRDHRTRQVPGHARRRALDHARRSSSAAARRHPGCRVLQIDAHADLRDALQAHAAQPRLRDAPHARVRAPSSQVGIRNISTEEADGAAQR